MLWGTSQGLGCSTIKAVRELGSERRQTVRSLSIVVTGNLQGSVPSTREQGWTDTGVPVVTPAAMPGSK